MVRDWNMNHASTVLERSRRNLIALTNALVDPRLSRESWRQVHAARAKLAAVVRYREKLLGGGK